MDQQLGIDQLKKDLKVIAKVTATTDKAFADGKVSALEAIGIAKDSLGFFGIVRNWKTAKAELNDLTSTEKTELIEYFKKEFDIADDTAEMLVELTVETLLGFVKLADVVPTA